MIQLIKVRFHVVVSARISIRNTKIIYGKINHGFVNLSYKCDVKAGLNLKPVVRSQPRKEQKLAAQGTYDPFNTCLFALYSGLKDPEYVAA